MSLEAAKDTPARKPMYTELGETEQAVDWLEKAFEERVQQLMLIKTYPR